MFYIILPQILFIYSLEGFTLLTPPVANLDGYVTYIITNFRSALYGLVSATFMRKVSPRCIILAR